MRRREPFGPHRLERGVVRCARERTRERERTDAEHLGGRSHQIADGDGIDTQYLGGGVGPEADASKHQPTAHRNAERAQPRPDHARRDGSAGIRDDEQRHTPIGPDRVQRMLARRQVHVDRPAREHVLGERLGRRLLALEESAGRVRERHVRSWAG